MFSRPIHLRILLLVGLWWIGATGLGFASEEVWPDHRHLARQLASREKEHRDTMRLGKLGESLGGHPIWLVELASGNERDRTNRPALLAVAGLAGHDLVGTASLLHWIDHLLLGRQTNEPIRLLLERATLYIIPRVNPDAVDSFFGKPLGESILNRRPFDDDHDGFQDEDGPEDVNGDGLISWMRFQDPEGEWIPEPSDPRLLIRADRTKGEVGVWKLISEGVDNDHDNAWNEDGLGGVNLNRNFPYDYKFFATDTGLHQVSEPETRALADFIVTHPSVGIVFAFADNDNLTQTPKGESGEKRPPEEIRSDDLPYYRELGAVWRETLGIDKEQGGTRHPGSFSDWIYFHRGRLGLAARAWSPELQVAVAKKQTAKKESEASSNPTDKEPTKAEDDSEDSPEGDKPKPDSRSETDRAFLEWLEARSPERFLEWKRFDHPDFPGRTVEIGGFAPFAQSNPPSSELGEWTRRHAAFLTDLAGRLPRVGIRKMELKDLGARVFELKVQVENTGYLPTVLAQGQTSREVIPTRLTLGIDREQLLGGSPRIALKPIAGSGGMEEARWVFHADALREVELEIVSALGGRVARTVELKEDKP